MHGDIYLIELESMKNSPIHSIDPRVKLITIIFIIVCSSLFNNLTMMALFEIYLIISLLLSNLSLKMTILRILMILPFGIFIVLFQPFIRGETVLYSFFGINIFLEGLNFGILLFAKFFVSITCIVLLSSTTPTFKVVEALKKLGLPAFMSMVLGLMIRYIYLIFENMQKLLISHKSRGQNRKKVSYISQIKNIGNLIGTLFLKSYEQGERTYFAMLSRGYGENSDICALNYKIRIFDILYVVPVILIPLLVLFYNLNLF
ncbi:cobalt ECF transporter T component CbiQ [Methanococcus voltae]|uniref:Cobalt ABC transporter, inner membrane subunit CbiQ n=1 Tax=Methanococcus voltae (strain ATCC BAA-1334 / A3) TaxID=456320 RepID=D7DU59_METV3|nr:cobalt ECF transporter T component CbiQ [Methanococcus voltae]MCS3900469.1 cobalt/nickel transport system permease protein [Methanococcus voltae]